MIVRCPKCSKNNSSSFGNNYLYFACAKCKRLFVFKSNNWQLLKSLRKNIHTILVLGQKGIFDSQEYTVTGILIKKDDEFYEWTEYILQSETLDFIYLSEYKGHWTILKEVEDLKEVRKLSKNKLPSSISSKFKENNVKLVSALGFFDFNPSLPYKTLEYDNTPYLLSIEESLEKSIYVGKYFTHKEMKIAFGSLSLPPKKGYGLLQPFLINVKNMSLIFIFISLFLAGFHYWAYSKEKNQEILDTNVEYYNNEVFITPSFEVEDRVGNLIIKLYSSVSNSWTSCDMVLVNESNNNKEYAFKDIEYYYGYSEGETWSEGNREGIVKLCGVGKGKYHMEFTMSADKSSVSRHSMKIEVLWIKPSYWNLLIIIGGLVVILVLIFVVNVLYNRIKFNQNN